MTAGGGGAGRGKVSCSPSTLFKKKKKKALFSISSSFPLDKENQKSYLKVNLIFFIGSNDLKRH